MPFSRRDAMTWWLRAHNNDISVAAAVIGVSRQTVYRWLRDEGPPMPIALLIDQIANGPAVKARRFIREDWEPRIGRLLREREEKARSTKELARSKRSATWRRNLKFRAADRLALRYD